jgi:acyl-CoA reductase-like NAD-dependent aldehyde dehydrogenase
VSTTMTIRSVNPATEEEIASYEEASDAELEAAIERAWDGFRRWRRSPFDERSRLLSGAADALEARRDELAGLMTAEMGKPIVQARAEVDKCCFALRHYAEHGESYLTPEAHASTATESYVQYAPLGPILHVMPWNFPFWQVVRAGAPALMAGNTILLKHASNVTGCGLALAEVFADAPEGVFQTVVVRGSRVGPLIADDRIRAVTLTGSDEAGAKVAAAAGQALKKCVLELGGSDAFIVLEDADLDAAVETAVRARFQNTGQSCIAAKRFLVVEDVADEFEERFAAATAAQVVGDPTDEATAVGPLARPDLRDDLESQLERSLAAGGRVLTGGGRPERRGYFFEPTVVSDVRPGTPLFDEETFGPVAAVTRVRHLGEALELANRSVFGLSSNVWSRDVERVKAVAGEIEAGGVFINGMTASDPRLPFGGVKRSGYGRELGAWGIREFVNTQTVWVGPAR